MELTEALLSKAAGWEAMKRARSYLERDQVLSSDWAPPLLRGLVQTGDRSLQAGLVIKGPIDIDNLCPCRESRESGVICAHSVAVGLHWLKSRLPENQRAPRPDATATAASPVSTARSSPPQPGGPRLLRSPEGEPVELCLILPPNFEQAVARGKVMLVLEANLNGTRRPLAALPAGRPFAFNVVDGKILDHLEKLGGGQTPAMLSLGLEEFAALLPLLAGHAHVTLGRSEQVTVTREPLKLPLRAELEATGEIVLSAEQSAPAPLLLPRGWVWHKRALCLLGLPPSLQVVLHGPVRIERSQVPAFLNVIWPGLEAYGLLTANFAPTDFTLDPARPRFVLELAGGLASLTAQLRCFYGGHSLPPGERVEDLWVPDPAAPRHYLARDLAAERSALARLHRGGFAGPDDSGALRLQGQDPVLNFFAREFPRLQREWSVTLEERLERSAQRNIERIEPKFQIASRGFEWFDLGVVFSSDGGEEFSNADIQRLLRSGQSHTRLKNGKVAVLDTGAVEELQEVLLDCAPQQHDQGYRLNNVQAGFLEATLRQQTHWKVAAPEQWRERAARQLDAAAGVCPPLDDLEPVLRPYQKQGVAWLQFLRANNFGGILADEMGLGKTLQTLAYLRCQRRLAAGGKTSPPENAAATTPSAAPCLVVCPTSLVFNWVAEAKRFTPDLAVLALHGPDREPLFAQIPRSDLVITSYALIRRDAARYSQLEFDTVVLDEAQHIKNRQTQNARAVKAIRAAHRLVLTGTPLENSVLDLWSIFDFLMPGYLGSAQDFRERYELPITRDRHPDVQARLARRVRPFLLRRLKKEVAADLPARLEQVVFCDLTADQRRVYQQLIEAGRNEVLAVAGTAAEGRSRMLVLTLLLRLRQVCCDLRLLDLENNKAAAPAAPSAKLDLFEELLEEVIDGGHRLLVFSQFVSLLTLLKEKLTAEGTAFCYLDGATVDRAAVVERFQNDSSIPVFLISLKAGGTGLNLTGADTVIHFDPWWNPSVEDQATGRAHRIGQQRVVTSYKLIARDTVEEKILLLQKRKRETIQATLEGEGDLSQMLTWEEMQALLA